MTIWFPDNIVVIYDLRILFYFTRTWQTSSSGRFFRGIGKQAISHFHPASAIPDTHSSHKCAYENKK